MPGAMIPLDERMAEHFHIREYEGYDEPFTRDQDPLALFRNGSRVIKVKEDPQGDLTPLGSKGTVLGSIGWTGLGVAYFIAWDRAPRVPTFLVQWKLAQCQDR